MRAELGSTGRVKSLRKNECSSCWGERCGGVCHDTNQREGGPRAANGGNFACLLGRRNLNFGFFEK